MEQSSGLGDRIHSALATVGISQERVEVWLGGPCGCDERREKLNQLGAWAIQTVSGRLSRAREWLENLMEER